LSDETFQEKIKRLEAENPQPEYCDCDGHHDGSCHQRRIDVLRAALERAERDRNNLLARIHRDGGHYHQQHGTDKAVADAHEIVAQLFVDRVVLADEVRACRYIDNCEPHTCHIGYEGHWYCVACKALDDISAARETTDKSGALDRACEAAQRTDENGALDRAKEQQ